MAVEFKIPEESKYLISSITSYANRVLDITFTEKYNNKEILVGFDINNIQKSIDLMVQKLEDSELSISHKEIDQIENVIYSNILDLSDELINEDNNNKENRSLIRQTANQKKKKEITVNKYSFNRKGDLYESILVEMNPYFLKIADSDANDSSTENLTLVASITESTRILVPPTMEEYLHDPYDFESKEEIDMVIQKAKDQTTFFSLYTTAKSIVSKYIEQEQHVINLIAVDIIFSYFQDRFSTTHYVGIFGDNESGKSSIGDVVEALAYRAVNTTDPTQANIYRSLGSIEAGQITLILDESEKIDRSEEMMSILKTGYDIKKLVSRINQYTGKPEKFHTYCYKLIIGERPPGINKAKGVLDRTFQLTTFYGVPAYNIKEVLNPTSTGGDELKRLLNEILEFRKLLFMYRLIHFKDAIKDIDIELKGRDKELVKPCLQLFSDPTTDEDKEIYLEIKDTFYKLLELKGRKKDFTLEAAFLPLIIELMHKARTSTVSFSDFWNGLRDHIPGNQDEKKPNEYHTEDFGTIYRNSISDKLQKLGVDTKRHNRYTELIFNRLKIMKNLHQYNITIQTEIVDVNEEDRDPEKQENKGDRCGRCEGNTDTIPHKDEIPHGEIHKIPDEKDAISESYSIKNDNQETNNVQGPKNEDLDNTTDSSQEHSQHSQHSPNGRNSGISMENYKKEIRKNIYRIGNTDQWGCKNCRQKGDIWYMEQHTCKGIINKPNETKLQDKSNHSLYNYNNS